MAKRIWPNAFRKTHWECVWPNAFCPNAFPMHWPQAHFQKRMQATQKQQSADGNGWSFSAQWSTKPTEDGDEIIDMDSSSVTEDVPRNLKGHDD